MKVFQRIAGVICVTLVIQLSSCATIPSEAPELSMMLGERISALEDANINLLYQFFELKRTELEHLMDEWSSDYIKARFETESMKKYWGIVISEKDPEQRNKFFYEVSTRIQRRIRQERNKYIDPLDELERMLERKLRGEYADVYGINNSITTYLSSASKVAENRNRYLEMVGVRQSDISQVINQAGNIVNKLTTTVDSAEKLQEGTDAYLIEMKNLIENVKNKFEN